MKKYIYSIFAVVILLALSAGPLYSEEKDNNNARFKLFNAEYNSALIQTSKTTVFAEKKLLKIDTMTGKTWMLIDVFKEGKDIMYWKEIKNTPDK
ncbi:MAG: hypothetical protein U9R02_04980 [Thermodesulfobacteriota bacterium]|nr:hypothetical protein [Thermodesulfobacteriota bacterium]